MARADQREEINAAYQKLIQSGLRLTIERVANEHPKTPDVVKFGECVKYVDVCHAFRLFFQ